MDPGFCWLSWVSHCGCWALFFHDLVFSPEPFLLEWGKEVGRTMMEIIQGMLEIGRDHSPFLVLLKLSLGLPILFFFFLSMGEGKRGQFGKMSCVATLSAEGTAGISMGLLETSVFFFFG